MLYMHIQYVMFFFSYFYFFALVQEKIKSSLPSVFREKDAKDVKECYLKFRQTKESHLSNANFLSLQSFMFFLFFHSKINITQEWS